MAIVRCLDCRTMDDIQDSQFCTNCEAKLNRKPRLVGITMPDGQVVRLFSEEKLDLSALHTDRKETE